MSMYGVLVWNLEVISVMLFLPYNNSYNAQPSPLGRVICELFCVATSAINQNLSAIRIPSRLPFRIYGAPGSGKSETP